MALWKRGRRWWTQTMINGVRIRQPLCPAGSTRATTKWQEAVQLEKDLIKAALAGKLGAAAGPKNLFEACDKYLAGEGSDRQHDARRRIRSRASRGREALSG